jgi:hypothetical protein
MSGGLVEFVTMLEVQNNDLLRRLRNSLRFFSRGMNEPQSLTKFLFLIISLEALFSRDKGTPIRVTLADYSSLSGYPLAQRRETHALVRRLYDVRSAVVHNGAASVSHDDVESAERLAATVIMSAARLVLRLVSRPDPEDAFFDHLLSLKLK